MGNVARCGVCGRAGEPYTACPWCYGRKSPPPREDAGLPPQARGEITEKSEEKSEAPWTRAEVMGWKRKAEAYDVIVECCVRLQENGEKASPITEAMLDAVIEAKRLREEKKRRSAEGGAG